MRDIRGSEISDFLKDRFTWKLRWLDKLVPNKPQTALFTGTLIHKFLEVLYQTGNEDKALQATHDLFMETNTDSMEQFEVDDMLNLVAGVTAHYTEQWKAQDANWKVITTELTFRIPLDNEIAYTGTIDLIYLDENDNLWIADHKTTKSIEGYEKNALLDRQISRYIWAVQQLALGKGYVHDPHIGTWVPAYMSVACADMLCKSIHGFLYNLILKEIPQPPKLLKKGGLSKDKSQHTTFQLYCQELEAYFEKPLGWDSPEIEPYSEILEYLRSQETEFGNRYFKRVPVFRLQEEVDASIRDFHAAAKDLIRLEKEIWDGDESRVYMNITKDTSYNAYQPIIAAVIEGSNVDLIKNNLYHIEEEE